MFDCPPQNADVAHEHVAQGDRLRAARDGEGAPVLARRRRGQVDLPPAAIVGGRLDLRAGKRDGHGAAGVAKAPHGHGLVALQDHVIGEDLGEPHLGRGHRLPGPRGDENGQRQKHVAHGSLTFDVGVRWRRGRDSIWAVCATCSVN